MTEKNLIVLSELKKTFPQPKCELNFKNEFELLVAVILSAQCTDRRVNQVTPILFEKAGTPEKLALMTQSELEEIIHSCGFFTSKAKNIIACCKKICESFEGNVPKTFEELCSLGGVGRKTANVVLSVAFNVPRIAVDTHVFRVAARLGIAKEKTPDETEKILMNEFPENEWIDLHYRLVLFGRRICDAKKPKCADCPLTKVCDYFITKREK